MLVFGLLISCGLPSGAAEPRVVVGNARVFDIDLTYFRFERDGDCLPIVVFPTGTEDISVVLEGADVRNVMVRVRGKEYRVSGERLMLVSLAGSCVVCVEDNWLKVLGVTFSGEEFQGYLSKRMDKPTLKAFLVREEPKGTGQIF